MRIKCGQMLGMVNGGPFPCETGSVHARFGAVFSIIQLRIPPGATPLRRHVKDGPKWHQVGRTARGSCPGSADAAFISPPQKCLIFPSRFVNTLNAASSPP